MNGLMELRPSVLPGQQEHGRQREEGEYFPSARSSPSFRSSLRESGRSLFQVDDTSTHSLLAFSMSRPLRALSFQSLERDAGQGNLRQNTRAALFVFVNQLPGAFLRVVLPPFLASGARLQLT
jgi:hypothetical protein